MSETGWDRQERPQVRAFLLGRVDRIAHRSGGCGLESIRIRERSAIPPTPTCFLALPTPGEATQRQLHRKLRLLALRTLLTFPAGSLEAPHRAATGRLQAVLRTTLERSPAPLLDAIGSPDVLAPLLVLARRLRPAPDLLASLVPALLVGLARRGSLPEAILWDVPIEAIADSRGHRRIAIAPAARAMVADAAGIELELADGTRVPLPEAPALPDAPGLAASRPFHALAAHPRLHLSTWDSNPLALDEAHPDKHGNALSLGDRPAADWVAALDDALELVKATLPAWYAELPVTLERLVPVGFEPERHLSASYAEAPGLAYLTLHPSVLTLAEAVVHETQHGKLNTLTWFDPVLVNGHTAWASSPVRPDLRPLHGILLAVHAFVPVAALHAALADAEHPVADTAPFARRRADVLAGNARGLAILAGKAEPTPTGRRLLTELQAAHDALARQMPGGAEGLRTDVMPH